MELLIIGSIAIIVGWLAWPKADPEPEPEKPSALQVLHDQREMQRAEQPRHELAEVHERRQDACLLEERITVYRRYQGGMEERHGKKEVRNG